MIFKITTLQLILITLFSFFVTGTHAMSGESIAQKAIVHTHEDPELEWVSCPEFFPEGCRIAVLQGDPSGENADIFFKVPPDSVIPHHWHTSAERMVLVSGELHLDYDGQDTKVMKPGTYAYGPAKLPHKGYCVDGDPCVLFIAFELPIDAIPTEE